MIKIYCDASVKQDKTVVAVVATTAKNRRFLYKKLIEVDVQDINAAEFCALNLALKYLLDFDYTHGREVTIYSDNTSVIEFMRFGRFMKDEKVFYDSYMEAVKLLSEVRRVMNNFPFIRHISRNNNIADTYIRLEEI